MVPVRGIYGLHFKLTCTGSNPHPLQNWLGNARGNVKLHQENGFDINMNTQYLHKTKLVNLVS